jgi:hypothetical protein
MPKCWRRMIIIQILYIHVCKWKNDICWNFSRKAGREGWRRMMARWIQVWYICYILRTFINATMYFHEHNNKKKVKFERAQLPHEYSWQLPPHITLATSFLLTNKDSKPKSGGCIPTVLVSSEHREIAPHFKWCFCEISKLSVHSLLSRSFIKR